jgi:hypothetical protein
MHAERMFNPDRKDTHWGKRKLNGINAAGPRAPHPPPGRARAQGEGQMSHRL